MLVGLSCWFLGTGCASDGGDTTVGEGSSGDGTTGMTASTTMTSTMSTTDATTASTSMSTTVDPATTDTPTDSSGDPSTVTDATETGPSDTTGSPLGPCDAAADDTPCDECVKDSCCSQLTACADDPECVCFQDCASSMRPSLQIPMICGDMCGIETPFAHPTVGQVLSCSFGCSGPCGV